MAEGQGSLAVNVLKLMESSQAASVRFSTRDILVGKSHHPGLLIPYYSECLYNIIVVFSESK